MQKYLNLVNEQCAKHGWSSHLYQDEPCTIAINRPSGVPFVAVHIAKYGRYTFTRISDGRILLAGKGAIAEATRSVILANTLPV